MAELIGEARAQLKRTDARAEGVHEARKAFKKGRAIARLVRASLGPAWRAEDRFWRDLGRALSAERDAQAVLEAFDALLGEDARAPAFESMRELLVQRHVAATGALQEDVVRFPAATPEEDLDGRLVAAGERVQGWPLGDGFAPLAEGIEAGYRRARRRGRRARREPSASNLHAWRRAVKQHGAQVRLFRDAAPEALSAHLALVDELAHVLGEDHDLEVLRTLLTQEDAAWADPEILDGILERMARRHARLRRSAFSLGERALAERPKDFRRRLRAYWRAHVKDQTGERRVASPPAVAPEAAPPDQAAG
ncbi:MAG TPA: CHAD domain-containing protein [Candidatus Polarisedimenticolaceae bacterium]|nr:CHAD domain-containing protein [Candidatus Polarisedimenticolaceae bacterium]